MSATAKLAVAGLTVVAAGVLFFVLQGDEDPPQPATVAQTTSTTDSGGDGQKPEPDKPKPEPPEVATIEIEGGQPVGGVEELSFSEGEAIRFVVESDVAGHVHLHGYDVIQDVAAGDSTEFDVPATITGVFEAELEDSAVPIAEITVEPN